MHKIRLEPNELAPSEPASGTERRRRPAVRPPASGSEVDASRVDGAPGVVAAIAQPGLVSTVKVGRPDQAQVLQGRGGQARGIALVANDDHDLVVVADLRD